MGSAYCSPRAQWLGESPIAVRTTPMPESSRFPIEAQQPLDEYLFDGDESEDAID